VTSAGRDRLGTALAAAWLAAVAVIAVVQAVTGSPHPASLASTPDGVAHGRVWTLLSSGLIVNGVPVAQLAGTALVVAATLRAFGGAMFWVIALTGHVGATLLTYVGVGLLSATAAGDVDRVIDAPDYGISAVWAACLGALAVKGSMRGPDAVGRLSAVLGLGGLVLFAALVPLGPDVAAVEHLLAFALGGAVVVIAERRRSSALSHVTPS
jgi:hypothetical protein